MGSQTLGKGDGVFIPADHAYSYQVGPRGVELLEFRNAANFNFVFKGNNVHHWEKLVSAFRDNSPAWKDEIQPSMN